MGVFLTFEGVEGCGKTTQLELLHSKMKSMEIPVLATREPGGTDLGRGLRDILLFSEKDSIDIGAGGAARPEEQVFNLHEKFNIFGKLAHKSMSGKPARVSSRIVIPWFSGGF